VQYNYSYLVYDNIRKFAYRGDAIGIY